jgi:predicted regulator of Ras-like GTPase activity (Roadblock/LC7/MglB family)
MRSRVNGASTPNRKLFALPALRHSKQLSAENVPLLLKELLKDMSTNSPIIGAAIFSVEGLPFVSYFHAGTDDVSVAAMVASLHSASAQIMKEMRQGSLKSIIVEGTGGKTIVIAIAPAYLLAVIAPENARTGLVFNDAKRVAREASRLLQEVT